ncbi:ABC transporter substrate-binding protein [Terribacillus saccharophilus]|uniref:ABC transporter substrate-binding protein n=1 Tax=Terribacillus saccharophilus TaxID=361277 RepID=UPI0038234695
MNKKFALILFGLMATIALFGCSSNSSSSSGASGGEPVEGGDLNVAMTADPDTLDWMYSGESATRKIGWHIYEGLFALDHDYQVRPLLADDYTVSDDKKTYTITLRDGLKFHNGQDVTAEDAKASIDRWLKVSSVGKITASHIDSVEATDDLTLVITLNDPYTALLTDMSAPKASAVILPADIAAAAGEQPLTNEQLIGTGPFKFDSWKRGNEIVLSKFEDYQSREEEDWGGLTGKKTAYLDTIHFKIVKDPQVMLNGLKTDLYDYVQSIPLDLYDVVDTTQNVEPAISSNGYSVITPDKSEAPFDDIKVREALHAALDKEAIAKATYGNSEFYNLDGALFTPDQTALYSDENIDNFEAFDQDEAKKLLEESSYDGQAVEIIFSNDHAEYKKIAEIAEQQLEAVGFNVELESYEWATYLEKWSDGANWDMVVVGWSPFFSPNQAGVVSQDSNSSGWYNSERWQELIAQWGEAEDEAAQQEILAELNKTIYDELPFEKVSNLSTLDARTSKLQDYDDWYGPRFWNTWKSQ